MSNKAKHTLGYLFSVIILSSCTEKINFDLNKENNIRLVVEGYFTTEAKTHRILLTQTSSYFANETPKAEENAKVEITDGARIIQLVEIEPGIYETPTIDSGIVGIAYTLNIERSTGEKHTATSLMKPVSKLDSITYSPDVFFGSKDYILYLWSKDTPGEGDFYQWDVYIDSTLNNARFEDFIFGSDEFVDGSNFSGSPLYHISIEDLPNDTTLIEVKQLSITKEFYEFYIEASLETAWKGSPFDGPPANIKSNVSNGALGFFATSDVSSYQFKLIK